MTRTTTIHFALVLALSACTSPPASPDGSASVDADVPDLDASTLEPSDAGRLADAGSPPGDAGPPPPPPRCGERPPADTGLVDDPAIVAMIEAHESGWLQLPPVNVEMQEGVSNRGNQSTLGPVQRDFSNTMQFAPDRNTALYVGGDHQIYRANDVWEYHLGSNTWRTLFGEAENHARYKPLIAYAMRDSALPLPEDTAVTDAWIAANWDERLANLAHDFKAWWQENGAITDGRVTTRSGGPIMPSHQWDGVTYDARSGELVWISGANGFTTRTSFVAWLEDISFEEADERLYGDSTTWTFSPSTRRWAAYSPNEETPRIHGMGASLTYISDECRMIYYVAASNVVPGNFRMHWWDRTEDAWEQIRPANGSIWDLAAAGVSPPSEAQLAYAPARRTLYAVKGAVLYAYSLDSNEWSVVAEDARIVASDQRSIFVYDSEHDALIYLNARAAGGPVIAAFEPDRGTWEVLDSEGWGPAGGHGFGYYDPTYGVVFVARGPGNTPWIYRYAPRAE